MKISKILLSRDDSELTISVYDEVDDLVCSVYTEGSKLIADVTKRSPDVNLSFFDLAERLSAIALNNGIEKTNDLKYNYERMEKTLKTWNAVITRDSSKHEDDQFAHIYETPVSMEDL